MLLIGRGIAGFVSQPVLVDFETAQASFTLVAYDYDVLTIWGASEGQRLTFAAIATSKEPTHSIRGVITKKERLSPTGKRQAALKCTLALEHYEKREHDALACKHGLIIPDNGRIQARRYAHKLEEQGLRPNKIAREISLDWSVPVSTVRKWLQEPEE